MRKIFFSFFMMTGALFSINAQIEFHPIFAGIRDITSNDNIVLTCNASCKSYIRAYDMNGEELNIDIPTFNNYNSFYGIKKNEKGAFLIGGVHYQSDDVIGLENGSFVIKYNIDGQLELSKDISGEDVGDLIFSFINNDLIALGIGNEKLLIINNKGLTVDSILLNSKIIDVSYLNETEFVILDENHNIFIIDQTNKILKTYAINSNIHSTINIQLTNINNQKIL